MKFTLSNKAAHQTKVHSGLKGPKSKINSPGKASAAKRVKIPPNITQTIRKSDNHSDQMSQRAQVSRIALSLMPTIKRLLSAE